MTAYSRDPVEYEGEQWFADAEPLRERMPGLCRERGVVLHVRRTTDPSSLRGYRVRWSIADGALWLVALEGRYYRQSQAAGPPRSPFEAPPGASIDELSLHVLFPATVGPALADWYTGSFPLVDQGSGWATVGRRVELTLVAGRVT